MKIILFFVLIKLIYCNHIDLFENYNAKLHHTDKFESVKTRGDLIVRRGDFIFISIEFEKPFNYTEDKLFLSIDFVSTEKSINNTIQVLNKTNVDFKSWSADIYEKKQNTLSIRVYAPPIVPVGQYSINAIVERNNTKTNIPSSSKVFVLFNPWCKNDTVYMENEQERNEYILNDVGYTYLGSNPLFAETEWFFAQFKQVSLDAIAFLLKDFMQLPAEKRGNATLVSQALSSLVNANNDFGGILEGRWSEPYRPYTRPTEWTGSLAILEKFLNSSGEPVKYGQCWVFGSVLTTVCRALGIPARPITNFASGHDTDETLTIDSFFDENGVKIYRKSTDSTWNFHVWTEVWLNRNELPSKYSGWQVIDATPQELSDGLYKVGPASVNAIKFGDIDVPYDGSFVFAEMNSDTSSYMFNSTTKKYVRFANLIGVTGSLMLTKRPGVNETKPTYIDITSNYQYKNGTSEDRGAFLNAMHRINVTEERLEIRTRMKGSKDLSLKVLIDETNDFGSPVVLMYRVKNHGSIEKNVTIKFKVESVYYNGKKYERIIRKVHNLTLAAKEKKIFDVEIKPEDYIGKTTTFEIMRVTLIAINNDKRKILINKKFFTFKKPTIPIKLQSNESIVGTFTPTNVEISLINPLRIPLTECKLNIESQNIEPRSIVIPTIETEYILTESFTFEKQGKEIIIVKMNCKEISDLKGKLIVNVKSLSTRRFLVRMKEPELPAEPFIFY